MFVHTGTPRHYTSPACGHRSAWFGQRWRKLVHLVRLWIKRLGSLPLSLYLYKDYLEEDGVAAIRENSRTVRFPCTQVTLDLNRGETCFSI